MKHLDNVDYRKMHRLERNEVKNLGVGDLVYFQNDYDENGGQIYDAMVIEKHTYHILLHCTPMKEFIPLSSGSAALPHKESYAYNDAVSDSGLVLFKNVEFK